jgi:NAD(P)-dependent dehydrogenase (short-subunit alcohol dehydrogenase family)
MGIKENVSGNYMTETKNKHANKKFSEIRNVLITGDSEKNGIGAAIRDGLPVNFKKQSFQGDIRDPIPEIDKEMDTLIMSHGVCWLDWFEDCPEEKIKEVIDVNLLGTIRLAKEFVKATIDNNKKKQIIIIGSMAGKAVLNGSAAYCASKSALIHLTKCLAWELAPKGYDVFCINPSNTINTPMTEATIQGLERYRNLSREDAEAYWGASLPKAEWLNSGNISDLANFLLSGKAEYLSGCSLDLAGGQR